MIQPTMQMYSCSRCRNKYSFDELLRVNNKNTCRKCRDHLEKYKRVIENFVEYAFNAGVDSHRQNGEFGLGWDKANAVKFATENILFFIEMSNHE